MLPTRAGKSLMPLHGTTADAQERRPRGGQEITAHDPSATERRATTVWHVSRHGAILSLGSAGLRPRGGSTPYGGFQRGYHAGSSASCPGACRVQGLPLRAVPHPLHPAGWLDTDGSGNSPRRGDPPWPLRAPPGGRHAGLPLRTSWRVVKMTTIICERAHRPTTVWTYVKRSLQLFSRLRRGCLRGRSGGMLSAQR